MTEAGLYVHVPFCVAKCRYCAFASEPLGARADERLARWLEALDLEAAQRAGFAPRFDTLYVGGGTPSAIGEAALTRLFTMLRERFVLAAGAEITVEVNPGDATRSLLRALRGLGVSRLSVGVQSLDGRVLRWLSRRHDATEALRALERARSVGFDALSLDLIYGVPGQSRASWLRTLERTVAFRPEHYSCYMLTVEPGTPLARATEHRAERTPNEALLARRFVETSEWLAAQGYRHDEVSSFSRAPRFRARHNGKYWRHHPYLGLGPAAHSFSGRRRWWNAGSPDDYGRALRAGATPVAGSEQLGPAELALEALALGLRTAEGVPASSLRDGGGDVARALAGRGWLRRRRGSLCPTRLGLLFADRMAVELSGLLTVDAGG